MLDLRNSSQLATGGPMRTEIEWTRNDPQRVSATLREDSATLTLVFDIDNAWMGDARLLEVRLSPTAADTFEPWQLMPQLPLHLQYARAAMAREKGNADAAMRALRKVGSTRRGHDDEYLGLVAQIYTGLVAEGEPHPIKTLAKMQHAHISTASRWVKAARARGLLKEDTQ